MTSIKVVLRNRLPKGKNRKSSPGASSGSRINDGRRQIFRLLFLSLYAPRLFWGTFSFSARRSRPPPATTPAATVPPRPLPAPPRDVPAMPRMIDAPLRDPDPNEPRTSRFDVLLHATIPANSEEGKDAWPPGFGEEGRGKRKETAPAQTVCTLNTHAASPPSGAALT
jgi:hypothetical protein